MTRSKLLASVVMALCATSALADNVMQLPVLLAAGGQDRPFSRANGFNPGQNDRNSDAGNEPRQQQEAAPARDRNEGFGYGFERRQERSARPDGGRRGRN